jgi:hypothetical protein
MQRFLCKLTLFFLVTFANTGSAEEGNCNNFGSMEFYKINNITALKECFSNASQQELTKIHPNGNTAIMNAVVANMSGVILADLLSKYEEDLLDEIYQHKNFEELSVVHLAGVAQNGPSQLTILKNFGADFTMLREKKEGYIYVWGVSPLHYALSENAPFENILALLALGVDPLVQDKKGNQAINYALSKNSDFDVLNLLLTFTKKYYKNDNGYNALHFAVQNIDDVDKLNLVFNSIDDSYHDEPTNSDASILHLNAATAASPEIFSVVLKNSVLFACKEDSKGAKAISYARQNQNIAKSPPVIKLLNQCS